MPPHVNEALEAMLAVDPDGRPDSVAAVAALLFPDDADLRDVAAGRLPPRPVPLEGVLRPNTDAGVAQTLLPDSDPNLTMIPTPAAAVSPPLTVVSAGRRWGPLVGAMLVLLLGVGIATVGTLDEPAPAVVAPRVVPPPEAGATNVSEVPVVNPGAAAGGVPGVEAGPGAMAAPRAVPAPAAVAAAPEGEVASVASPGATALPAAALGSAAVATPAPVVEAVVVQPVAAPSAPPEAAVPAVAAPTGEWTGTAGGRPFVLRLSGGTSALQADVTVTLGITDRTSRYAGRMGTDGLVVLLEVDGTGRIEGRFGASSGRGSLMVGKGKPLTWEVGR